MLVLSRKKDEKVLLTTPAGVTLLVTVIELRGDKVRLGFEAPTDHAIHREEVHQAWLAQQAAKNGQESRDKSQEPEQLTEKEIACP